jgi:hypothetical protein
MWCPAILQSRSRLKLAGQNSLSHSKLRRVITHYVSADFSALRMKILPRSPACRGFPPFRIGRIL